MTNEEKINTYFDAMAVTIRNRHFGPAWGVEDLMRYIRRDLNAIKELLVEEPEPETLAASVFRLTDTVELLKKRNDKLEEDLTRTEALLNIANRKNRKLKAELAANQPYIEDLRKELNFKHRSLKQANRLIEDALQYLKDNPP